MPQMAPLMWDLTMIYIFFSFSFFFFFLYYIDKKNNKMMIKKLNKNFIYKW